MKLVKEASISWADRSEIAAHFIRPNDIVCDLGAGRHTLRRFLPQSVAYYPVDRGAYYPDNWVADLSDENFTLPPVAFTVVTCLGVLSKLANAPRFVHLLAEKLPGVFIIVSGRRAPDASKGSISHFTPVARLRSAEIYTGILDPKGAMARATGKRPLHELILSNCPVEHYARAKLALVRRRLAYGGNSGSSTRT